MEGNIGKPLLIDWWYIDARLIPEGYYKNMTINIPCENGDRDEYEIYQVWTECEDENGNKIISFPRYCDIGEKILAEHSGETYLDYRTEGEDIDFEMNTPPRDHFQEQAIEAILNSDHGICQAKTAFGKTYVAINVISKLKKKALILVHKIALAQQWKNDILNYTNLKDDDIEILQGPTDKYNLDKPIIISTVQNFVSKINAERWDIRNDIISANFGITFFDEVHATAGPKAFVQSTRWFASKRIYGLSATPTRGDDFDKTIRWTVGNILYKDERPMMPVYLTFVEAPVRIPMKRAFYLEHCGMSKELRYLQWFTSTTEYKEKVVNLIVNLIKMNKKILAVGKYKDILQIVFNLVQEKLKEEGIPVSKVIQCHGTSDSKLFDLDRNSHSCVFSTHKYFSDGLSVAWLDTLVYLTPPSANSLVNIPQIIGRIVRTYEGKNYVTVYDVYNSEIDKENSNRYKRHLKYSEFGYHVVTVKNDNPAVNMETTVKDIECSIIKTS